MTGVLLAHGGSATGPNVEALILAAALIVLGIALFVQKSAKPVVSVVLVVAGIGLAAGGFTFLAARDEHRDAEVEPVGERAAVGLRGLCDAREDLEEGDTASASAAFFDRSHGPLHDIADRLGDGDRAAAADLLEAKQAVESGFEAIEMRDGRRQGLDALQRDLDRLIIAAVVGASELGVEVTGCK